MRTSLSIASEDGDARARRSDFDTLSLIPARRVTAAPAKTDQLDRLILLAQQLIPPLAAARQAVFRVHEHNPDSIWAVEGKSGLVGVFAMLILNRAGLGRLLDGRFDAANPSSLCLAARGEPAAAIYLWAIATPGVAVEAFRIVSRWLAEPPHAKADIFTRPTTQSGARFALNIGFQPLPELGLYQFQRHRNRTATSVAVA